MPHFITDPKTGTQYEITEMVHYAPRFSVCTVPDESDYLQCVEYGKSRARLLYDPDTHTEEPPQSVFPAEKILVLLRKAARELAAACAAHHGAETVWWLVDTYMNALYACYYGQCDNLFGVYKGRSENAMYVAEVVVRRAVAAYEYLPYLRSLAESNFPEIAPHAEATLWPIVTLARTVVPRASTPA